MSLRAIGEPRFRVALPSLSDLAAAMTTLAVLVLFLVSSKVLQWIGLPYSVSGGSALAKFHPATFLSLAALALTAASVGPGRLLASAAIGRPGLVAFAFAILLLFFQAVVVQKLPLSAIADTFVMPLALFLSIISLSDRAGGRLATWLHVIFFANSAIGYFEYVTGLRLTPYYQGAEIITYDWRATALFGHPLSNALMTGVYLLVLSGRGGRRFDIGLRAFLIVFNLGAMAAFGGRAATVVALGLLGARAAFAGLSVLAGQRFSRRAVLVVTVAVTLVGTLGTLAILGGFLDSFLDRFQNDYGSADTRVAMFHVFDGTNWHDYLFAPDLKHIAANQQRLDLAIAIESFIVAFFAYYGAVTTILFFSGLFAFSAEIVRAVGVSALLPLGYYFTVSSTSTGIANKTIDLAMITAMLLLFLGRRFLPSAPGALRPC
jgi:hypothetical protein